MERKQKGIAFVSRSLFCSLSAPHKLADTIHGSSLGSILLCYQNGYGSWCTTLLSVFSCLVYLSKRASITVVLVYRTGQKQGLSYPGSCYLLFLGLARLVSAAWCKERYSTYLPLATRGLYYMGILLYEKLYRSAKSVSGYIEEKGKNINERAFPVFWFLFHFLRRTALLVQDGKTQKST